MNAKKCDRCGHYYEPYRGQDYGVGGKTNRIVLQNDLKAQCAGYFDLCPACMEKQLRFLQGAEIEEKMTMEAST